MWDNGTAPRTEAACVASLWSFHWSCSSLVLRGHELLAARMSVVVVVVDVYVTVAVLAFVL
jgi:hypothetical protein